MKSIMQNKDGRCYLCQKLYDNYNPVVTEEHHCISGPNRNLSERYGLKVWLCIYHHREGKQAVHSNIDMKKELCQDAQRAFEAHWPELSFREIFGKNYL